MSESGRQGVMQCGLKITTEEFEQIREAVELLPGLAVNDLVATICEHLEWYTAGGGLKVCCSAERRSRWWRSFGDCCALSR